MDAKSFNTKVARSLDISARQAAELIDAFAGVLRESARTLDPVALPSFGSFTPVKRDETVVTDRITGQRLLLPPQITIEFNAASMLRKKINRHA